MKRSLIAASIFILLTVTPCLAQKVTVDPNARTSATAADTEVVATPAPTAERYDPAKDPDTRMAQKTSYEAHHSRLSTVIAELAEKTGVGMACGTSKKNWQVRDVPVTIYAKDLPLGALLHAIARATHNVVGTEKSGNVISYRIYQDPRLTRQFEGYATAVEAFRKSLISYNWDGIASLKDIPSTDLKAAESNPVRGALRMEAMRNLAQVMSGLPPDYKQRVMDGEQLSLSPNDVPQSLKAPLMTALGKLDELRLSYDAPNPNPAPSVRTAPLAADELQKLSLTIMASDREPAGQYGDILEGSVGGSVGLQFPMSPNLFRAVDPKKGNPIKVKPPTRPDITEDSGNDVDVPDSIWNMPDLDKQIDMDDLASAKNLDVAGMLFEAMKRAGISVVVEDWDYFKSSMRTPPAQTLKKQVKVRNCVSGAFGYTFRADVPDKLYVAIDDQWAKEHQSLAPASAIDSLTTKLNSSGADIEDLLPVMSLSNDQWLEWVQGSRELGVITHHLQCIGDPVWQFYAGLTPPDRAQAATSDGLVMSNIDPAFLADVIARSHKFRDSRPEVYTAAKTAYPPTPNEQGLAQLVMHLRTQPTKFHTGANEIVVPKGKAAPRGLDTCYVYSLDIIGTVDNSQQTFANSVTLWELPFYSQEREAELLKSLMDTSTGK